MVQRIPKSETDIKKVWIWQNMRVIWPILAISCWTSILVLACTSWMNWSSTFNCQPSSNCSCPRAHLLLRIYQGGFDRVTEQTAGGRTARTEPSLRPEVSELDGSRASPQLATEVEPEKEPVDCNKGPASPRSDLLVEEIQRRSVGMMDKALMSRSYVSFTKPANKPPIVNKTNDEGMDLDDLLAKTANTDKVVILTMLNNAWASNNSMADMFLESFRMGQGTKELLAHLLMVAMDADAYRKCTEIHPHCFLIKKEGVDLSAEKTYMTEDYLKMVWMILEFLGDVLRRGYNFLYSDTDIMWLRNPFPILNKYADIQVASDFFSGNPHDMGNLPNCGFKLVRSNNKTIHFYQHWYESRVRFPGHRLQYVINILKMEPSFKSFNMNFIFLDTKHFGGFCSRSEYIDDAYTMHANCCKGMKAKLADLRATLDEFIASKKKTFDHLSPLVPRQQWSAPKACPLSWFEQRT